MILDHGYTGIIESSKSEEIVKTDAMMTNPTIMKPLFVKQSDETSIDANYVLSIMVPIYSEIRTRKRSAEEMIIGNFQDLHLSEMEEGSVAGYSEVLASKEDGAMHTAEMTAKGVLGWLTGQRQRPLFGEELQITVEFDHDCLARNPDHRLCFPVLVDLLIALISEI